MLDYDAELRLHHAHLRRASNIRAGEHVLDIGCGIGQTTCEAARAAGEGSALGVDISAAAIERARQLAQGLGNVTFECADAQVHRFGRARFDLVMSRFGTMFFADPVAAFANIRLALRPAGRLVMMVWQAPERNEWEVAIRQALPGAADPDPGSDAFSLADPAAVRPILDAAGFAGVSFTDVDEPVYYGPDVAAALDWIRGFQCTRQALDRFDPAARAAALARLREVLAARLGDEGVWFGSRAWIVSAVNPT